MKKIIHFSDIHIGHVDAERRFRCIVDHMLRRYKSGKEYVVLISGDLVEVGSEGLYKVVKRYLDKLEKHGFTLLMIPGNHDYGSGALASKKYVKLFKRYFYDDTSIEYPKLDIIENAAFLGLDSLAEELNWHDRMFAEGQLGQAQLERLDSRLRSDMVKACEKIVVYLHHHPFDARHYLHRLKDSEALGEVLTGQERHIDALLFGHQHYGNKWNGVWGIPRCLDAGSTTRKNNRPGYHRVIDLEANPMYDFDADFHCNAVSREDWPDHLTK